jgi:hypothetical protein
MKTRNAKQAFGASALKPLLATATLALLVATSPAQAAGRKPNPGVIPPGSTFRGLTYGEWGARFWTKLFAIPVVGGSHPYLSGGAFEGDQGVVFLTASGNGATFDITIKAGTPILCPVLNAECSVLEPDPFHGDTEAELRACANGHMDNTSGLFAIIDGVPVKNLGGYRVESPLFEFTLPEDNLFAFFGLDAPGGTTSPAVDAGVYLLLAPLSPGKHTIHVGGSFDVLGFTFDNTFHITVE